MLTFVRASQSQTDELTFVRADNHKTVINFFKFQFFPGKFTSAKKITTELFRQKVFVGSLTPSSPLQKLNLRFNTIYVAIFLPIEFDVHFHSGIEGKVDRNDLQQLYNEFRCFSLNLLCLSLHFSSPLSLLLYGTIKIIFVCIFC